MPAILALGEYEAWFDADAPLKETRALLKPIHLAMRRTLLEEPGPQGNSHGCLLPLG